MRQRIQTNFDKHEHLDFCILDIELRVYVLLDSTCICNFHRRCEAILPSFAIIKFLVQKIEFIVSDILRK